MRWTNSGFTPESTPRTAAGWEVFFPARLLFWHVGLRPAARPVPDRRSKVRACAPGCLQSVESCRFVPGCLSAVAMSD